MMLLGQELNLNYGKLDGLKNVQNLLNTGGVFVTYAAKGSVRRALEAANLMGRAFAGPSGQKGDVESCTKNDIDHE